MLVAPDVRLLETIENAPGPSMIELELGKLVKLKKAALVAELQLLISSALIGLLLSFVCLVARKGGRPPVVSLLRGKLMAPVVSL